MSELIIIQESSNTAAKDLDRPMCLGPEGWVPENPSSDGELCWETEVWKPRLDGLQVRLCYTRLQI